MPIEIPAVAGTGSLSSLAEIYRQQVLDAAESGSTSAAGRAQASRSAGFASVLADGISSLEAMDADASAKAVAAATGDLSDVHDYVIAATSTQVATELTTTIRNKALEAFNDILRMPL
jgi:flagellar hook-basal body complex protein FliE